MIQFLGVSKTYDAHPEPIKALDNISFEISEGEFVFLVGHSGSGKTTILRQMIREELPSEGRIFFYDQDITKLKRSGVYKLRRQIGIIFQDYKLIEDKNAYENVAFAMEAAGQTHKEILETVPYVLDIVNLTDRAQAFPRQLSGGEKQRVAIARAIANNPKLLIADEPTGNLDPDSAWDIVQILSKINKWGTTIIMSTHGTEIVNSLQKRVIQLEKGKLTRDDKKGLYNDVDEYSLKVMSKRAEDQKDTASLNVSHTKPENKEAKAEVEVEKAKKETKTEEVAPTAEQKIKPSAVKSTLETADQYDLKVLKLPADLVEKLLASGYKDVEDILSAGVGKVNEVLTKVEVKKLAKAIKKFVTSE